MQCFDFSKQLLLYIRRCKQDMVKTYGNLECSKDRPVGITLRAEIDYDPDKANPLKEITLRFTHNYNGIQQSRRFKLEVPEGVLLRREEDIEEWLTHVFEFITNSHGIALEKAKSEQRRLGNTLNDTNVYPDNEGWGLKWLTHDGTLDTIPIEAASVKMDKLAEQTLKGWKPSTKDDKLVVKSFRNKRTAENASEMMHLLMLINGYEDEELYKSIKVKYAEDKTTIRMPAKYLELAIGAEKFIDF